MSSQNSPDPGRGVVLQKPKADIYTALLGIALAAIVLAIICLWMELARYKYDYKATGAKSAQTYIPPAGDPANDFPVAGFDAARFRSV